MCSLSMHPPSVQGTSQLSGQPALLHLLHACTLQLPGSIPIMGSGLPLAGFNFFTGGGEYTNQTTQHSISTANLALLLRET
jgi:hypothetical protein